MRAPNGCKVVELNLISHSQSSALTLPLTGFNLRTRLRLLICNGTLAFPYVLILALGRGMCAKRSQEMPHSPIQLWRIVTRRAFAAAVLISILTGAAFALIHKLPLGSFSLSVPSSFANRRLAGPLVAPGTISFLGAPYSTVEGNSDHDVTITLS